ncbi:MAG: PilW family protein [Desulfuromonadales bacterium]|nr:PilW family protein [Desulfuromonadales bacterium]
MNRKRNRGFTLVELLVALALAGIVSTAIYNIFFSSNKVYVEQEQVVGLQQDLRAGVDLMVREIRMAGFDPDNIRIATGTALGLVEATRDTIEFTFDTDGNGVAETIRYAVTGGNLTRNGEILVRNVDALGFAYAYEQGSDVATTPAPPAGNRNIIWVTGTAALNRSLDTNDDGQIDAGDTAGGNPVAAVTLDRVRAVRVWLLARTERTDSQFSDSRTYVVADRRVTPADNFRRRLLTTTLRCRNLGL